MRAVRFHEHGGPGVLRVDDDVAVPDPGPDEVLVRVGAAGVNPVDTYFREGEYPVPDLPFVPGSDCAGTVDAVGADVEEFAAGDRVFATGLGNGRPGTYAEYVAVPTDRLAHLPEGISFEEGAAVALVAVTAWRALVHHAAVEPGETVLVHGGSGGVGHVAVQLGNAMGARVTTTAREEYRSHLQGLGADTVLDYRRDDLADAIAEAGAPDVVLDPLMNEYFPLDGEVAAQGARIVGIGNTADDATVPVQTAKGKELRYQMMSMFNTPRLADPLARVATLLATGRVAPDVAATYPLEEAGEAQRAVMEDSVVGKLVVLP